MNTKKNTNSQSTQTTNNRKWRRAARVGITTAVLAGTVSAGVGLAGGASAAPAAAKTQVVEAWSINLPALNSRPIPQLVCPPTAPFLIDQDLSPGRLVPRGVEVVEQDTGIGVTIGKAFVNDPWITARGTGSFPASATNWSFYNFNVSIKLHCTSDRDAGYWVAPDNREWGNYGS